MPKTKAATPRIVSGKMVPYEVAEEVVCKSCPSDDIICWFTSFNKLLLAAANTTWDPVTLSTAVSVLEGLLLAAESHAETRFNEAMKMIEEATE